MVPIQLIRAVEGDVATSYDPARQVSHAALSLFVKEGTTRFSVKELAEHAGISERTFYRYFPRKEDVVRPVLSGGANQLSALLAARPVSEPVLQALKAAFALSWWGESTEQAQALRELMHETDVLRTIWLDIIAETETRLRTAIAARLGLDEGANQARLIANVVCAVIRSSAGTCDSSDPHALTDAFARDLDCVAAGLFGVQPG
ncbi:MAG: TetR/AcrR family transcriptional regulator [Sphingomonadales bacterium]|nr:TetR/AcrR family transcriptional regulator [Sphingomonadales bacterium]